MSKRKKPQTKKPKKAASPPPLPETPQETEPAAMLVLENFPSNLSTWYPGIQQACVHWREAEMLQQTFSAFEQAFSENNDAVIDGAKSLVEVVCRIIIDEFHTDTFPCRPNKADPSLSDWLSSAVKSLKLGDIRDERFKKLVSCHHKLADALNALRNDSGPVSHGKDGYLARLSEHHRRSVVLAADAIVAFLFEAFTEANINLELTREPYERFTNWNSLIDQNVAVDASVDDEDGMVNLLFRVPGGDEIPLKVEPSRLLYQLDRPAYVLARNASLSVPVEDEIVFEDSVQDEVVPAL